MRRVSRSLPTRSAHLPTWSGRSSCSSPRLALRGAGGGSRYRRPKPHGPDFRPGDTVRETGIYEVIHDRSHRAAHEVVLVGAETFPPCDSCGDRVRFRLVRTAPYIFSDEDFETGS